MRKSCRARRPAHLPYPEDLRNMPCHVSGDFQNEHAPGTGRSKVRPSGVKPAGRKAGFCSAATFDHNILQKKGDAEETTSSPPHAMTDSRLRIVFMGTPDFAAKILRAVAAWEGGEVLAAYAQPDRPAGRGRRLREPDVKVTARELGIPVLQPPNFREQADRAALAALKPDVLVVAAYGLILPQAVLDIPAYGAFNVHASLLPRTGARLLSRGRSWKGTRSAA